MHRCHQRQRPRHNRTITQRLELWPDPATTTKTVPGSIQHGVFPNPVIILETQLGRAMLFKSPPDLCIIQLALFNLNQPIHPI
jgi:hypothetical protein